MKKHNFALIDMGSNSIRLVIYCIDINGYYKEIHNIKIIARLSSHIQSDGNLSEQGLSILIEALQNFQDITNDHNVSLVRGVATAAIRQAKNQKKILKRIEEETNFKFRVLSEYEEAFYGYLAVVNSTNISNGITIDIGGGSTEITLFQNRKLIHYHSFPFGAITLKQMFCHSDIPTVDELNKLRSFIKDQLQTLSWLKPYDLPVIGIGGSARNLSLVHQRSIDYPLRGLHQYEMKTTDIYEIKDRIEGLPLHKRQQIDGLSKDRADIIIPAIEVISLLTEEIQAKTFIMSNKGLRDGIFYEELLRQYDVHLFPNVAEESFYQLSHEYEIHIEHIKQVTKLVTYLFYELQKLKMLHLTEQDLHLLRQSARVLYIGEYISQEASSQNTFYILANQSIDGLFHMERLSIAFIASFKSKSYLNEYAAPYKKWLTKEQLKKIELLGAMLKFCYSLNRTRRNTINRLIITMDLHMSLKIHVFYQRNAYFEQDLANKYKKHMEKALKLPINLIFTKARSV